MTVVFIATLNLVFLETFFCNQAHGSSSVPNNVQTSLPSSVQPSVLSTPSSVPNAGQVCAAV